MVIMVTIPMDDEVLGEKTSIAAYTSEHHRKLEEISKRVVDYMLDLLLEDEELGGKGIVNATAVNIVASSLLFANYKAVAKEYGEKKALNGLFATILMLMDTINKDAEEEEGRRGETLFA